MTPGISKPNLIAICCHAAELEKNREPYYHLPPIHSIYIYIIIYTRAKDPQVCNKQTSVVLYICHVLTEVNLKKSII
jgi:hypothetical protein